MNLLRWFYRSNPGEYKVEYTLSGDSDDFNVTYKCGYNSDVVQEAHVKKGWKQTFVGHTGDYFFLAAQSNKPNSSVRVKVYENGQLMSNLEKEGNYPLVTASGTV